jgi:hypothetical protein
MFIRRTVRYIGICVHSLVASRDKGTRSLLHSPTKGHTLSPSKGMDPFRGVSKGIVWHGLEELSRRTQTGAK